MSATFAASATSPVRHPDVRDPDVMTKRAWWLVGLNILIPGSAQLLAGHRKLGRFGVAATFVLWALVILGVVIYAIWPGAILTIGSTPVVLWLLAAVALFYAGLWVVLTLDTLRLVRLVKAAPNARGFIAGLSVVVLALVSGSAAYGGFVVASAGSFISDVFVTAPALPPVDGRYNFLLLGGDAGPDRDGLRPDSISVVSVEAETGAAVIIGLPRNLEGAPFPESSPLYELYPEGYGEYGCGVDVCMLNSIYTEVEVWESERYPNSVANGSEPGIDAMRDAASGITGLEIQYYVLIDMQGFSDLIDSLGGVTIDVAEAVPVHSDETFTTVHHYIGPGEVHMDGYTALWYARSRHDTSDYDRMERQRQLQLAILQQFNPANILTKFQDIAQAGAQVVRTDIPQESLGYFVQLASKTKDLPIVDLEMTPVNDVDPEDPDFDLIRQLVADATAPPVVEETE